jgi:predicted PurR-regulated permease PerM
LLQVVAVVLIATVVAAAVVDLLNSIIIRLRLAAPLAYQLAPAAQAIQALREIQEPKAVLVRLDI